MAISQFTTTGGILLDNVLILGGTIDVNGVADSIILDADGDTHISAPTDDQIDICVNGSDDFRIISNNFTVLSGSVISGSGSTFVPFIPLSSQQSLSGAGAIDITTFYTAWTSTGADAGTLADGAMKGQLKKIRLVVDGGDATLTPNNASGFTTITFNDANDEVLLGFNGTAWVCLENNGATLA